MTLVDHEKALLERIDTAGIVALTSALIGAGGENPGDTELRTAEVLVEHCREAGLDVRVDEVAPGRPNVVVSVGGDEIPGVLFVGHSDVVPAGGGWTSDPFRAVVREGRIFGRGACDMKGGLAAVVAAMTAVHRAGLSDRYPMTLACLVDEEDTGLGIRAFVGERTGREYSCCVVAEPTDLVTIHGCRGAANLEITVTGRSAHAGQPANGVNAISAAARIVTLIDDFRPALEAAADPHLGAATFNVGTIGGGTGTSMVADRCVLTVDRRLLPGESAAQIARELEQQISDAGIDGNGITVSVSVSMEMPGFLTDPTDDAVAVAVDAVRDSGGGHCGDGQSGGGGSVGIWTASCDGGFVDRDLGVRTLVLGPGEIETQAHKPDESVEIRQLLASARAYALIGARIGGSPASS